MFLNSLRNNAFWILDYIKGGQVKKYLADVAFGVEKSNFETSKRSQQKCLEQLLFHASRTTPFYNDFKEVRELTEYPVIRKTMIQDNFNAFRSKNHLKSNNHKVSTSGSTGASFFLYQDMGKRQRNSADVIYFTKEAGYKIGSRLYELKVWRDHNKRSKFKSKLQNIVQFDISKLTDHKIDEFLNLIQSDVHKEKCLLGFASAYEMIALYLERHDLYYKDLGISAAISSSEYLNSYTKTTLGNRFQTQVLSRYSSEELGIIAQQTLKHPNHFVINHASYKIELLNFDSNEPVNPGEFGRIVITDLFNYAMPIIRYDTGDVAKMGVHPDGTTYFEEIQGRKMDMLYDTSGNIVSSFVVYTKFYKHYRLIKQYQFIQQSKKTYEIKLNLRRGSFRV
jgi:phenylacetate-CoA ligase